MSDWIACKDRLPDQPFCCDVLFSNDQILKGSYNEEKWTVSLIWHFLNKDHKEITHWRETEANYYDKFRNP